ncbi:MAG TPA: diguanylate cyclase [Noviherbaspirillum sp.]|jgi:diguanylate cyclase (GGDEF)-like protein|uniref:diguanylate cyclase n=1 Tax=Noviherbaspirillum sp. TaxID=1926288 RepID=UPI002DDD5472|nr:diguanylate cyclase [Noviherbaspirillum sp.]HEV2609032.1 diguanylate cyclase [Noviherbaspirillum sp.]
MRIDWKFKAAFLFAFLLVAVNAAIPWLSISWAGAAQERHEASRKRIEFIHEFLSTIKDAETGQRGFIITGKEEFLLPYQLAVNQLGKDIPQLERIIADEPRWEVYGREVISFTALKMQSMAETIEVRRKSGFAAVEPVISSANGKYFMDRIRTAVSAVAQEESAERDRLDIEREKHVETLANLSLVAGIANLFLLSIALHFLFRALMAGRHAAQSYQNLNQKLGAGMEELERRNREVMLLGQMARALESQITLPEAFHVIVTYLPKLLSGTSGALYMLRHSGNLMENVGSWGKPRHAGNHIEPETCWALRRGQPHATSQPDDLCCPHYAGEAGDEQLRRLCLPLTAQGQVLGLIYIEAPTQVRSESSVIDRKLEDLALPISEQVALALSNAQLRQILREQSIMDALTGLFNRRYMEETLQRELARATRTGVPLSLIVYDLDHFKRVNDTHGHEAGDAVLKACSQHVRRSVRESDVPCRYGGEEFVLILPDCGKEAAFAKADRLREEFSRLHIMHDRQLPCQVTATFGVASFPGDAREAERLFSAADEALYRGKEGGRNCVMAAFPDPEPNANQPAAVRTDLRTNSEA